MNCLFDSKKFCPLSEYNIPVIQMGRFCQACHGTEMVKITKEALEISTESLRRTEKISGGTKTQLILALLRLFPKEEEKAKLEYRKLMKRVEEW